MLDMHACGMMEEGRTMSRLQRAGQLELLAFPPPGVFAKLELSREVFGDGVVLATLCGKRPPTTCVPQHCR